MLAHELRSLLHGWLPTLGMLSGAIFSRFLSMTESGQKVLSVNRNICCALYKKVITSHFIFHFIHTYIGNFFWPGPAGSRPGRKSQREERRRAARGKKSAGYFRLLCYATSTRPDSHDSGWTARWQIQEQHYRKVPTRYTNSNIQDKRNRTDNTNEGSASFNATGEESEGRRACQCKSAKWEKWSRV